MTTDAGLPTTERRLRAESRLEETISRSIDRRRLPGEALDLLVDLMGVAWGALFLTSDREDELLLVAEQGISPEVRREIRIQSSTPTSPGLAGRCAANRKLLVEHMQGGIRPDSQNGKESSIHLAEREDVEGLVALPLTARRGPLLGVIELGWGPESQPTEADLEILGVLGERLSAELELESLEREARSSRRYLERVLASSPDAIIALDHSGRMVHLNPGAEMLLGEHSSILRGRPLAAFLPGGEEEYTELREGLARGDLTESYETSLLPATGEKIPVSLSFSLVGKSVEGIEAGFVVVAHDLRVIHELKDEARRRDQFLANILTDSADAIMAIDVEDHVITWNRGAERMFGYMAGEMLGKPFYPLVPHDLLEAGEPAWLNARMKEHGLVQAYETRRLARDGRELRVSLTRTVIRDPEGRIIGSSAVVRDITGMKELEQRLIQSERLAAIGMMSTKVAHDIRNPLSSLLLNAELLDDELRPLGDERTAEARSILRSVQEELDRLTEITEDYLQFARRPRLRWEPCQLNEIVASLLELLDEKLGRSRIRVRPDLDPQLPEVRGDLGQLRRALLNILRNAIEAMPHGGDLHLHTWADESEVMTSVRDSGGGIERDELERIFSPFYSTKDVGTGLGLAVTQQIVNEHGGRITCESVPGEGSTFTMTIPRGNR